MAQSLASKGSFVQQSLHQSADEIVPLKRKKKDPNAPTWKSIVVLKRSDVTIGNDYAVFMPNTIEMAQLKKPEKGQFKTKVQISSKMSETDVRKTLIDTFPYLELQRFYCASAADNRTRLDFHGEPRVWDGRQIKQKIKGNSALYIFNTEEENVGNQNPSSSLKRPYDQIATPANEYRNVADVHSPPTDTTIAQGRGLVSSSAPGKQSAGKPMLHISAEQTNATLPLAVPHSDSQSMVSSTLTPQMSSLSISTASFPLEQGYVRVGQTVRDGHLGAHSCDVPLEAITRQSDCNETVTVCPNQSKKSYEVNAKPSFVGTGASWNNATCGHQEKARTSESDYESQSSDVAVGTLTDSGIETSDSLFLSDAKINGEAPTVKATCETVVEQDSPTDADHSVSAFQPTLEDFFCNGSEANTPDMKTGLFGDVEDIFPICGSIKDIEQGNFEFRISLNDALPNEVQKGEAQFEGVANVEVHKLNPFTLKGVVPPNREPGEVPVTVIIETGQNLGCTLFEYKDESEKLLEQIKEDSGLKARFFFMLYKEFAKGNPASASNVTQAQLGPLNVPDNDSSIQTKQLVQQSVKHLQLMTTAQTAVRPSVEETVFTPYEYRPLTPVDIARANDHVEFAQYVQDVNTSYSVKLHVVDPWFNCTDNITQPVSRDFDFILEMSFQWPVRALREEDLGDSDTWSV